MTLTEQYAHDYRDMAMSEEELRKMLEEFSEEIRQRIETYTLMGMNAAGVPEGEARMQARIVAICVLADIKATHITK